MCKPCKDSNVQLTQLKDSQFLGTDPNIDKIVKSFIEDPQTKVPGCALGVVYNNEVAYLKGYGLADVQTNRPFTIGTPSGIGSISKTVTALGVLRLVDQGLINLEDKISKYLPFAPYDWKDITIHQLLSHTSKLPKFPQWGYPSTEEDLIFELPNVGEHPGFHPRHAYWTMRFTDTTDFESRSDARYSNVGYALLGAIIDFAIITGNIFTEEVGYENFIYESIGLNDGRLTEPTMITPCLNAYWRHNEILDLARGYRFDGDDFVEVTPRSTGPNNTGWWGPPGGWTMTIGDLTRLMVIINTNARISTSLTNQMMTDHGNDKSLGDAKCGYGVLLLKKLGKDVFMHGGDIQGYTARYVMWPNEGVGVAVMCNRRNEDEDNNTFGSGNLGAITEGVGALVMKQGGVKLQSTQIDLERQHTAVHRVFTRHERQIMRLLELYQYKHGTLEKAVSCEWRKLYRTRYGKQLIRGFRSGDFESAAAAVLGLMESYKRPPADPLAFSTHDSERDT